MIVGFVGSGSMAAAIARGWSGEFEAMLFSDSGSGHARELAGEQGGETVSNEVIARRADLVVLAVKPNKLEEVAPALDGAREIVSVLAVVPLERLRAAFPGAEHVLRVMPNVGVEVRSGVLCVAGSASPEAEAKLDLLGHVVEIADSDFDEATAIMGCAPAYLALAVEALADAGAAAIPPTSARRLPRRAAAPRSGSKRSSAKAPAAPSRRRWRHRWRGCASDPAGAHPRQPRRLRGGAVRRLHDPDLHPDRCLVRAADALQPIPARGARLRP